MCQRSCINFSLANLSKEDIEGKEVLEVGSRNVNGTLRTIVESLEPAHYLGVDIQMGPGVDEVCDACDLLDRFGGCRFDWLISSELLEHVRDWQKVISNFKHVVKPGG